MTDPCRPDIPLWAYLIPICMVVLPFVMGYLHGLVRGWRDR
jgi:hypothetical protein